MLMNNLNLRIINDKTTWEKFTLTHPEANFLASWNWGQFHLALHNKVFFLGLFHRNSLVGTCLVVKETAKRGNYLTVAGGPIIDWHSSDQFQVIIDHLKSLAQQEHCLFVRIRPQIFDTEKTRLLFSQSGLRPSPMHLTADLTLQLELTPDEAALLTQMRKNTRYSIKQADRLGIKVSISQDPNDIKSFYAHQLALAQKHHFVPFSYDFLHQQFKVFSQDNQAFLFHSTLNQKLLASAFVIFYNQEAVYHYGISTPENNKLPGSYSVLWAAIKEAKSKKIQRFNFWGIAPESKLNHRFAGVTLFKMGFGGHQVAYLPAHDLPTSILYSPVRIFELFRARQRNLQ